MTSSKRVALVIGSGSVKCAAALGLMQILEREKIDVDMVVGCSGGSLYATAIALGWSAQTTTDKTLRLWTREVTRKRNRKAILQLLMPGVFKFDERFSMIDDRLLNQRLIEAYAEVSFSDMLIPLFITATDLYNGSQVVFYVFPPHRVDGRYLIDGYLADPLPVGIAIREGADLIIAIGFESAYQSRISSLARYAFQISSITSNNLLTSNYAFHNLAHHSEIIPIIPEIKERIGLFDTGKIPYMIEEGKKAAEEQLPYIQKLLDE
jgi:NTE family protein